MFNKNAFTLVEALTVVGIIIILSTTVLVVNQSIRNNSRDMRRVNDVNVMRSALSTYYSRYNHYPTYITPGERFEAGSTIYIERIPNNPTPLGDGCDQLDYIYTQTDSGLSYTIQFCLGSKQGSVEAGNNIAIPEGIIHD
jgi:type II secretory pathway pseudopilin PulG